MSIIGQMARHEQRLSDFEKGIIDRAVNQVWNDMGKRNHRRGDHGSCQ
jgi:conjugal transfer ATP-binding protein TraC